MIAQNSTNGQIGSITLESFVGFCDMIESNLGDLIIESGHDAHFQWYAIISGEVNSMFLDSIHCYDSFLSEMGSNMELSIIPRDNGTYSLLIWVNDNPRQKGLNAMIFQYTVTLYDDGILVDTQFVEASNSTEAIDAALAFTDVVIKGRLTFQITLS